MAFPIIPRKRVGAPGNPTALYLGELAVNCYDGAVYLGAESGVVQVNGPVAAGTSASEFTGDGAKVAFWPLAGYNGTTASGYLVSVGGIDQPPSFYTIDSANSGTITFSTAPTSGEKISVRAIVAGSGGGGSSNATQLQGRDIASTAPSAGQVLAWNSSTSKWQPTSLNGTVSFNTPGTHSWAVPAWVRYVGVVANAGDGDDGLGTDGEDGQIGQSALYDQDGTTHAATTGANGANGTSAPGANGKSLFIAAISFSLTGGIGGQAGTAGSGGGGSGGGGYYHVDHGYLDAAPGADGTDLNGGKGGSGATPSGPGNGGSGSASGNAMPGENGGYGPGGNGGAPGPYDGGYGGDGADGELGGGGGGGGDYNCGGGGGGGAMPVNTPGAGNSGQPGKGGKGIPGGTGTVGQSFNGPIDFSSVANTTISILISEGAGTAGITLTW